MSNEIQKIAIKDTVCQHVQEGLSKKDAAILAGISEATLYRWLEEDESFESRIEASIIEFKHSLIRNINVNAIKDGRLALEVLKRRFPSEWNGKQDHDQIEKYEGSTRRIADLLQALLDRDREEQITNSDKGNEEAYFS